MIKIYQSKTPEKVSSKIVSKIYDIAKENESDNDSDLFGYVQSTYGYQKECTYLKNKYSNFDIDILGEYYKEFVDENCKRFFSVCPAGDGTGITLSSWNRLSFNWENKNTTYGPISNAGYFGINRETVQNNTEGALIHRELLASIEYFPEIIDLNTNGYEINSFYFPMFIALSGLKEINLPRTCNLVNFAYINNNNLEIIDMSNIDYYSSTTLNIVGTTTPNLKKIILAPPISLVNHGSFTSSDSSKEGCQFFLYTKLVYNNPEASTWTYSGLRNATFWVQDSAYEDFLTHRQIKPRLGTNITLKKFSEYTGNDLVQKYIYTANLFDILYSNDDGEYYITSQILPTSLGYTPIALCVAKTGFFGPNEPARWMALKNMDYTTPDTGDVSQYPKSAKFGNYNVLIEDVEDITMMYENCTDETVYPNTDYQTNTVNMPNIIDSNGDWNISELGTVNMYALTDIDGKSKTYKYINLATAQSDWKTDETITNDSGSGYFPAACICYRYHTKGTYQGNWYLPALGEIMMVVQHKTQINSILNQIHTLYPNDCIYYLMQSGGILTSTEKSKTGIYRISLAYCDIGATQKSYNGCGIMAFLKF